VDARTRFGIKQHRLWRDHRVQLAPLRGAELEPVWLVFTAFAVSLVMARLLLGHVPDQLGGARVALVCVFIQAAGLALIWLAPGRELATAGAALAGFGYSLVYPGLGVEAVRRAPPESRGLAMGAYTVFLDVALGFGSPALGLIAGMAGLGSVFFASALIVLGGAGIALRLLHTSSLQGRPQCLMSS
jgi:MFS family permease